MNIYTHLVSSHSEEIDPWGTPRPPFVPFRPEVVVDLMDDLVLRIHELKYYSPTEAVNLVANQLVGRQYLNAGPHSYKSTRERTLMFWSDEEYGAISGATLPLWTRNFAAQFGVTPTIVSKAINREMMNLFHYQPWFYRFGFINRKIASDRCKMLYNARTFLNQTTFDGTENVSPFVLYNAAPPSVLRAYYGKGLWKRIASTNVTRNLAIIKIAATEFDGAIMKTAETDRLDDAARANFHRLFELPSTILSTHGMATLCLNKTRLFDGFEIMRNIGLSTIRQHLKQYKEAQYIGHQHILHTLDGIQRMGEILGVPTPTTLSITGYEALHAEYFNSVRGGFRSAEPFPYSKFEKTFICPTGDAFVIRRLLSAQELHEEGSSMHHCVTGYSSECYRKEYMVYTARWITDNADNSRMATIGIRRNRMNGFTEVEQIRGICNGPIKDRFGNVIDRDATVNGVRVYDCLYAIIHEAVKTAAQQVHV